MLHLEIQSFNVFVQRKFMFSMDENIKGVMKAEIFSVSSYENEALTFQMILEDGAMFSYVPIHLISHQKKVKNPLKMDDLIYHNCPSMDFVLHSYDFLQNSSPICYFKNANRWLKGEYLFTLEWYDDNLNAHLIKLENGQFAFLPSHKINFKGEKKLEKYHKIRETWRV